MSDTETRGDNIDLLIPEIQRVLARSAENQTTRLERLTLALLPPMLGSRHFSSVSMKERDELARDLVLAAHAIDAMLLTVEATTPDLT